MHVIPDRPISSDGPQPHFITVAFPREVAIQVHMTTACVPVQHTHALYPNRQKLSMYLSFPLDDSYTPATIAVRAGTGPVDLQDVRILQVEKPDGWITFDVCMEPNEDGDGL